MDTAAAMAVESWGAEVLVRESSILVGVGKEELSGEGFRMAVKCTADWERCIQAIPRDEWRVFGAGRLSWGVNHPPGREK